MYKITIVESVGEIRKEIILETEDLELVREIIIGKDIDKVESDAPNLMIDDQYAEFRRIFEEERKKWGKEPNVFRPYDPYPSGDPWIMTNRNPFEITC